MKCECDTELNIDTIEMTGEANHKTFFCKECSIILPDDIFEKIIEEQETNKRKIEAEKQLKEGKITQKEAKMIEGSEMWVNVSLNFKKMYAGKVRSKIVSRDILTTTTTDDEILNKLEPIVNDFDNLISKNVEKLSDDEKTRLLEILL